MVTFRTHHQTRGRVAAAVCVLTLTAIHAPVMDPRGHFPSRQEGAAPSRMQRAVNPVLRTVHVAVNPLALVVDAPTKRVFVFSATAHESRVSVLDAVTGVLLHTLRLGRQAFIPSTDGFPLPAVVDPRTGRSSSPPAGKTMSPSCRTVPAVCGCSMGARARSAASCRWGTRRKRWASTGAPAASSSATPRARATPAPC